MKPSTRRLLLAFSALGLGASATSTYVHYRLLTVPGSTSWCDVGTTVSCTQAYMSQYGSFMGVPVAPIGMLYFAAVLIMTAMTSRASSSANDSAPAYVFAASTVALAFVMYLAWASYFVLKIFCVLCAITYVSVVALFVISGGASSLPMTKLPSRAVRDLRTLVATPAALVTALLFSAAAVTLLGAFPREAPAQQAAEVQLPPVTDAERAKLAEWWDMQPKVDMPVPDNGAKVLVVKFNDYQCPACKLTHDVYKGVLAKRVADGQVRYVVKHYPLEPECNAYAPGMNHYASCEAAAAVIMARASGNATKMEDWIFANFGPPLLTPEKVKQAARDVGGIQDFDAQYARALEEVKTDTGLGKLLNVTGTPTFFINGRRLPSQAVQPQYLDVIIDLELKRAQ